MYAGSSAPAGWLMCNGTVSLPVMSGTSSDYDFTTSGAGGYIGYWKASTEEYRNLAKVIKTTYGYVGTVSSVTAIKLPDLCRRFPLGATSGGWSCGSETYYTNLGRTGGTESVQLSESEMPRHNHYLYKSYTGSDSVEAPCQAVLVNGGDTRNDPNSIYSRYTGGTSTSETQADGSGHNNIPPFLAVNFIIKY